MAVTGWKFGSANSVYASGAQSWTNPSNVYADDTAETTIGYSGAASDEHLVSGFGFTTADIPSGSTIDGIEVEIEHSNDGGTSGKIIDLQLHAGGTTVGTAKSSSGTTFSWQTENLGGAADTWGATLADTDVVSSTFGVTWVVDHTSDWSVTWINYIKVRVTYTENTSDALLANDVESASEVSSPAVSQVHSLSANDVESSTEVTSPTIGQSHSLSANDAESSSEVSSPSVGQAHALTADDVESNTEVSQPSVGQAHALAAGDVESNSELSKPVLTHNAADHSLLAEDVESTSEVSAPSVTQHHSITTSDVESNSELSVPGLTETHPLSAEDVEASTEVSIPALGQTHTFTVHSVESASEVTSPVVGQVFVLTSVDVESSTEVSIPVLTAIELDVISTQTVRVDEESREVYVDGDFQSRTQLADFESRKVYITL